MTKRSAMIGAAAIAVTLTACGNNVAASSGETKPDTLTVGGIFPMTGEYASYGEQQSQGVELALDQVNADGGAGGTELRLKIEDNKGEATTGVNALNKLISSGDVPFVFTSVSNIIAATAPVGTQKKVVMMNGGGTSPTLKGLSPYLFHNVPLENLHIENVAAYAKDELGLSKMGILYTDDALGQGDAEAMEETWTDLGGTVVAKEVGATTSTTFRSQLTQLKAEKPDVVYMALGGQHIPIALNERRELGIEAQVLGTSFWTVPETVEAAKGTSEGVIFSTQQWDPNDPRNDLAQQFVEDYTNEYGEAPQGNSAAYYVGGRILGDVIAYLNENEEAISGDSIKEALVDKGTFETIFGPLEFSSDGTSSMPLTLMTVEDGEFVPVKTG